MNTECSEYLFEFQPFNAEKSNKRVVADFQGGDITSDGGTLLMRELESQLGLLSKFGKCFNDYRDEKRIDHTVEELVGQRVYGLILGYEDLNDHDDLRVDPLLALVCGKKDLKGENRKRQRDKGKALAGRNTLNRLELTKADADETNRYKKIVLDDDKVERFFVDAFMMQHKQALREIILDLDATDDLVHGKQEGRFFHGYYGDYCYLPLYIFCGDHLLHAGLRESKQDEAKGALEAIERIVKRIRERWSKVKIKIRADSGFCRDNILSWCEENGVDYVIGIAKNNRLKEMLGDSLEKAREMYEETGEASRVFEDLTYRTLKSWSCSRRVVGKAEHLDKGSNPRFVVTSLPPEEYEAKELYEDLYCARGDMENKIKAQQLCLFADRTSCSEMRANQIRLWFSSVAYTVMVAFRRFALQGTEMQNAQCNTIRGKLMKIAARIKISARRVLISFASGCPYKDIFVQALRNIQYRFPLRC